MKYFNKFLRDQRGVSPVIGVILMVAITVVMGAVIAGFVYGYLGTTSKAPNVALSVIDDPTDQVSVLVKHNGGESMSASAWKGSPPGRPRVAREPDSAWMVNSVHGRSRHGPLRPKGVIDRTTRPGWLRAVSSASKAAGAKLSTTRSAPAISASTSGSPGRPTTERLPAARKRKSAPSWEPSSTPAEAWRRSGGAHDLVWPMRETVDYLRREMAAPDGGFYASQDADSEGE